MANWSTYNLVGGMADYPPGAHLLAIIAVAFAPLCKEYLSLRREP